ncbi:MAG: putative lipoic acid-binding regulatory protein [Candidatus Omnitrophota bacterium]|jgi:putative lipoic acid-binding regulatory protein
MDILNNHPEKPEINYPCQWTYKIFGLSEDELKEVAAQIMGDKIYTFKHSMNSKKGKYVSCSLITVVQTDSERNQLFTLLQKSEAVKMVL